VTQRLIKAFLVPALVAIYLVLFWRSTSGIPLGGQGVPRLMIGCIAILLVAIVTREVVILRRGEPADVVPEELATPFDADSAGGDLLAPMDIEPDAVPPATGLRAVLPMIAIIVSLLAYWGLLTKIGAYPSTALFVVGLSVALGYRKWLLIALSAIVCVAVVYAFIRIFTLPLPGFGWQQ